MDELRECGITYDFTNCRQDSYSYPILHDRERRRAVANAGGGGGGVEIVVDDDIDDVERRCDCEGRIVCSEHLAKSTSLFAKVRRRIRGDDDGDGDGNGGCVMFFCVAGQNRSATLAIATMLLHGMSLEYILGHCATQRPFVLENVGFQRQIVELESIIDRLTRGGMGIGGGGPTAAAARDRFSGHWDLIRQARSVSRSQQQTKRVRMMTDGTTGDDVDGAVTMEMPTAPLLRSESRREVLAGTMVEVELLIPGLCTMEVRIERECTITVLKNRLVRHVNDNLLSHDKRPSTIAKAWLILAMFGSDDMWDLPLEGEKFCLLCALRLFSIIRSFALAKNCVFGWKVVRCSLSRVLISCFPCSVLFTSYI